MRLDNIELLGAGSGAGTALNAVTASFLNGSVATYVTVTKNSTAQSVTSTAARLTNWDTPITSINAGEWNGTTGIFTATKAGVYEVFSQLQLAQANYTINNSIGVQIFKNASAAIVSVGVLPVTANIFPSAVNVSGIISLAVGDTLSVFGVSGTTVNTHVFGCNLTIQEIPARITR